MPAVHLGAEKRYTADDAFRLPSLLELVPRDDDGAPAGADGPVAEGEPVRQQLTTTCFDTADLRLTAAGLTLLRRTGGDDAGWHLEVPAGGEDRSDVRLPLGRTWRTVPQTLRRMVRAHSRGELLTPVAEIATDRTVRRLVDPTGQVLAEVADDRVTARRLAPADDARAGAATSWREIEVGAADGRTGLLEAVDAHLREQGLAEARGSAALAGLLSGASGTDRGTGPKEGSKKGSKKSTKKGTEKSTSDGGLTPRTEAGAVVLAHLREQVDQIRAQDLPVRLDAADSVHKMRVATRRLRSALTTFRPLFDADVVKPLRGELKWLAAELGAARDAEVMRDRVAATVDAESGAGTAIDAASGQAVEELEHVYREAHDRVLAALDGERYHRLLADLDALVTAPPVTRRARERAGRVLPRLVGRSYTAVRRLVDDAEARPAGPEREELLHDARKAAKAARYAGESVSGVFGADATAFARAMEDVQEALGEHQDSVLTRERLRTLGLSAASTEAAFLYGRLHALEEARAERFRDRFDQAWRAAGRARLHRWTR